MNLPDAFDLFIINEGEKKVSSVPDSKIPNAAIFTILKEDHTLGNIIRMELLRDRNVLFAGYKMPHPLEHKIEVKIQTSGPNIEPSAALQSAIDGLKTELDLIKSQFERQLKNVMHNDNDYL